MPDKETLEERRVEVFHLLRRGSDQKLLCGAAAEARKQIEAAYKLATTNPVLPKPWPALTAYRLAHLTLRRIRRVDDLHKADELLREAARARCLGPWPQIYRLSVMHRLQLRLPDTDFTPMTEQAFQRALQMVQERFASRELDPDADDTDMPRVQNSRQWARFRFEP